MSDLQAIPILLTPDIPATRRFAETLGFAVELPADDYAILRGHGIELHYAFTSAPGACEQTSCYIRGGGMLALYTRFAALPETRISPLTRRPWGMTEFYVHDPHGNLLKFGMSTDEVPPGIMEDL